MDGMAGLTETAEPFIFISYSRHDREYVVRLAQFLTESGIRCWFDHDMVRGESFPQAIARQIEKCAALLVVMTPSAAESRWVTNEIVYAQQLGKTILPLLLKGRPLISVAALHYEDVQGGLMPGEALLLRLRSLTGVRSWTVPAWTGTSATGTSAARAPAEPGHRTTTVVERDKLAAVTSEPVTAEIPIPVRSEQPTTTASRPAPPPRGTGDGKPPGHPAVSPKHGARAPATASVKKRGRAAGFVALALIAGTLALGWYATSAWSTWGRITFFVLAGLLLLLGLITTISGSKNAGCLTTLTAGLVALWLLYGFSWLMGRIWFTDEHVGWKPPTAALAAAGLTVIAAFITMGIFASSDGGQQKAKTTG